MFEIGKEYWFNNERKSNCVKDTCKGILQNIYSDGKKTLYSFTDVRIYERVDDECLDYDFYGTYRDTTVFENNIFDTAEEAFKQTEIDFDKETDTIKTYNRNYAFRVYTDKGVFIVCHNCNYKFVTTDHLPERN